MSLRCALEKKNTIVLPREIIISNNTALNFYSNILLFSIKLIMAMDIG